jgi:hypothetical protein
VGSTASTRYPAARCAGRVIRRAPCGHGHCRDGDQHRPTDAGRSGAVYSRISSWMLVSDPSAAMSARCGPAHRRADAVRSAACHGGLLRPSADSPNPPQAHRPAQAVATSIARPVIRRVRAVGS